jgi:GNAT superfamily N-acetyltransferase
VHYPKEIDNPFKYGRNTIYIHQISGGPNYQRKGVGRELMEAVDLLARGENIQNLALDTWEFNNYLWSK